MSQVSESLGLPAEIVTLIGVIILVFVLSALLYLIPRYIFARRLPIRFAYLFYSFLMPFCLLMDLWRLPRWRRRWLQRSGVREGTVLLEEGFGFGTSPLIAARMVGSRGKVYALDVMPLYTAILSIRAKFRRLHNLKVILADAKSTGLPNASVDIVFTCDAFHEFPDKRGALREIARVLKGGGTLSVWDETAGKIKELMRLAKETGLFALVEEEGRFCRLRKT